MASERKLANALLTIVFCLTTELALSAPTPPRIESVTTLQATPGVADVELIVSYDGSMGKMATCPTAWTKDMADVAPSCRPSYVPQGEHIKTRMQVIAPAGLKASQTELLFFSFYTSADGTVKNYQLVPWTHAWPQVTSEENWKSKFREIGSQKQADDYVFYDAFQYKQFAALDDLVNTWTASSPKGEDGRARLEGFTGGIRWALQNQAWRKYLESIKEWKELNPKSTAAPLVEAILYSTYAASAGLPGGQNDDPTAVAFLKEYMGRAEKALKTAKPFAAKSPLWYEVYLDMAIAMGKDKRFFDALFEEGVAKFPQYLPLYTTYAKWAWKEVPEQDIGSFLRPLAKRLAAASPAGEGKANVARFYLRVETERELITGLIRYGYPGWPEMKEAFEDLVRTYPGPGNLNTFAAYACRENDKDAYLALRPKLNGQVVDRTWTRGVSLDLCDRKFAQGS